MTRGTSTPDRNRSLAAMEFLHPSGVRLILDADGWRLVNPRALGQRDLERARDLRDRCEACLPPDTEPDTTPPIQLWGEHAASTLGLRITQHDWRRR
jgi:hypothetical protein